MGWWSGGVAYAWVSAHKHLGNALILNLMFSFNNGTSIKRAALLTLCYAV